VRYLPLLDVRVRHPYYPGGHCPDLRAEPTPASASILRRHRAIVRPRPGGLLVLTPALEGGEPFLPLPAGTTLTFYLRCESPDFALFTDLSGWARGTTPLYTNAGPLPAAGDLALGSRPVRPPRGVSAEVEIVSVDHGWAQRGPTSFDVPLRPKGLRWAYYFVTDIEQPASAFHLVNADGSGGGGPSFGDDNRTDLGADPDPSDAVAAELAERYPARRRVRFVSDAPVPCRKAPYARLELRLGGERLRGGLPNPPLGNLSTLAKQETRFQVLKHFTRPPPTNRS
jgi:hypothetical protein